MRNIVYAKVRSNVSRSNTGSWWYYAGSSLDAIRQDLIDWDDLSTLVQVTEEEARETEFFKEGKERVLKGEDVVFNIGRIKEQ